LFELLDAEFRFSLDASASSWDHLTPNYLDEDLDGLSVVWFRRVFVNPPYGRELGRWMKKAYLSSRAGATVVCLVPARTDVRWWHDYAMRSSEIRFVRGRLGFDDRKGRAPFPSCVVVFRYGDEDARISTICRPGAEPASQERLPALAPEIRHLRELQRRNRYALRLESLQ
jgi:hypothetical protein